MSFWGAPWGDCGPWGTGSCVDEACEFADTRVLVQFKPKTEAHHRFRDLICIIAEEFAQIREVMGQVALAFDVSSAVGDQLDKIGAVVGLPRKGYTDDRYRTFLEIQIDLLLSARREDANWTGTGNNILDIVRKFVGPSPQPVQIQNIPPYSYTLSTPDLPESEVELLKTFICRATYEGVLGYIYFEISDGGVWGSVHGPVPDEALYGSVHGPVVGEGLYGHVDTIGNDNC